jgi:hypothetical protein
MKVPQRDAKLDSYKLVFVASSYIREKIFRYDILENSSIIYTSSIYGIKDDDFINISWNDGLSDNKHDKKYRIIELNKLNDNEINDLKNKLKNLTTPSTDGKEETPLAKKIKAEQFLTDLVDKIGDPDISAIHKIGFANATPKQRKRYYDRLQMISDITNDENEMNAYPVTQ